MREFEVTYPCDLSAEAFWALRSDSEFDEFFALCDNRIFVLEKLETLPDSSGGHLTKMEVKLVEKKNPIPKVLRGLLPNLKDFSVRVHSQFNPDKFDEANAFAYETIFPVFNDMVDVLGWQWCEPISPTMCLLKSRVRVAIRLPGAGKLAERAMESTIRKAYGEQPRRSCQYVAEGRAKATTAVAASGAASRAAGGAATSAAGSAAAQVLRPAELGKTSVGTVGTVGIAPRTPPSAWLAPIGSRGNDGGVGCEGEAGGHGEVGEPAGAAAAATKEAKGEGSEAAAEVAAEAVAEKATEWTAEAVIDEEVAEHPVEVAEPAVEVAAASEEPAPSSPMPKRGAHGGAGRQGGMRPESTTPWLPEAPPETAVEAAAAAWAGPRSPAAASSSRAAQPPCVLAEPTSTSPGDLRTRVAALERQLMTLRREAVRADQARAQRSHPLCTSSQRPPNAPTPSAPLPSVHLVALPCRPTLSTHPSPRLP